MSSRTVCQAESKPCFPNRAKSGRDVPGEGRIRRTRGTRDGSSDRSWTRVLGSGVARVDVSYLPRYAELRAFLRTGSTQRTWSQTRARTAIPFEEFSGSTGSVQDIPRTVDQTPSELLEQSYRRLRTALAGELLGRIWSASTRFFEQLVIAVLGAMGYGSSCTDAGQAVGRSGDDGIDEIIEWEALGLDCICAQPKRWHQPVGRPSVQAFAGSLEGQRAH